MVLEMEAPEYLDLDEIDFSDDSVVSVTRNPVRERLFAAAAAALLNFVLSS